MRTVFGRGGHRARRACDDLFGYRYGGKLPITVKRTCGRSHFEDGDGCGSRCCSAKFWKARFRQQQMKMAAALRDGERVLLLWPETTESRTELRVVPTALTHAVAEAVARARVVARGVEGGKGSKTGRVLGPTQK